MCEGEIYGVSFAVDLVIFFYFFPLNQLLVSPLGRVRMDLACVLDRSAHRTSSTSGLQDAKDPSVTAVCQVCLHSLGAEGRLFGQISLAWKRKKIRCQGGLYRDFVYLLFFQVRLV